MEISTHQASESPQLKNQLLAMREGSRGLSWAVHPFAF